MNQNWEIFISFLKQKNLLDQYYRAIKTRYPDFTSQIEFVQEQPVRNFIDVSFIWMDTDEGSFFWEDLNEEWNDLIDDLEELFDLSWKKIIKREKIW
jgi:hypothetical protein